VVLPTDFETPLQVILMCDSYIGLDQVYNIDLHKINSKITASRKINKQKPAQTNQILAEKLNDRKNDDEQEFVWSDDENGFQSLGKLLDMGNKAETDD